MLSSRKQALSELQPGLRIQYIVANFRFFVVFGKGTLVTF